MDIFEGEPTMAEGIEPSKGEVLYIGKDPMGFLFGKEPRPIILEGWISVDDRLPDRYKDVFCLEGGSSFDIAHRISGDDENLWFIDNQGNVFKPTHWLPFTVKLP